MSRAAFSILLAGALLSPRPLHAQEDLEELSLEELLNVDLKVTSASKRSEDLQAASAAIYAVSADEVRRIGATHMAEALRIVPGVHVARADAQTWAISARGFNGRFNTRMLVLVDGRSVYTPLFGGVFWDQQDALLLEDLERIEVIRGPGGTLWGANGVNGVINATSRPAGDTQGILARAGGGTEDRLSGAVRWGGRTGAATSYRVWSTYADHGPQTSQDGGRAFDHWSSARAGFRVDTKSLTLQGDAFGAREHLTFLNDANAPPYLVETDDEGSTNTQYLLARWSHLLGGKSRLQVQGYVERVEQAQRAAIEQRNVADLDVQFSTVLARHHSLLAGSGVRLLDDRFRDTPHLGLTPGDRAEGVFNLYFQEESRFFADRLRLVAGSKLEHNAYTGLEVQPTARLAAIPHPDHTVWLAASRAVRTPSRVESDGVVPAGLLPGSPPLYIRVVGNPDLEAETLIAYEAGYRFRWKHALAVDLALFRNEYDGLIQVNNANAGPPVDIGGEFFTIVPFTNEPGGVTRGAELSAQWNVTPQLAVAGAWTHLEAELRRAADETSTPRDHFNVRLYMNVSDSLEWNVAYYYYEASGHYDTTLLRGNDLRIPSFARLDMGFTVRPSERFEIALWGQNLLEEDHIEVKEGFVSAPTRIERGVHARLTTRFR